MDKGKAGTKMRIPIGKIDQDTQVCLCDYQAEEDHFETCDVQGERGSGLQIIFAQNGMLYRKILEIVKGRPEGLLTLTLRREHSLTFPGDIG